MSMTRVEFEKWAALQRGRTVAEMRNAGYYSAPCPEDETGWQAVAIPEDAGPLERSTVLKGLVAASVKKFGEV